MDKDRRLFAEIAFVESEGDAARRNFLLKHCWIGVLGIAALFAGSLTGLSFPAQLGMFLLGGALWVGYLVGGLIAYDVGSGRAERKCADPHFAIPRRPLQLLI